MSVEILYVWMQCVCIVWNMCVRYVCWFVDAKEGKNVSMNVVEVAKSKCV